MNETGMPPSKIDLRFTESKVVCSISDCSTHKRFSFWSLNRKQAEALVQRLKHIERLTWRELSALDRERGLTPEKSDSDSFAMIHEQNSCERKLLEQYYFHIRIEQKGSFRIFGYQNGSCFYITHIDPNHSVHR